MTRWHKTFHALVFGAIVALAVAVFVLRRERRELSAPFPREPSEAAQQTQGR